MRFFDLYLWLQLLKIWLYVFSGLLIMIVERVSYSIMFVASFVVPVGLLDWFRYQWFRNVPRLLRGFRDSHVTPDMKYTTPQLCTSRGYPCEEHFVSTRDGFFIGIHRIPHSRDEQTQREQDDYQLLQARREHQQQQEHQHHHHHNHSHQNGTTAAATSHANGTNSSEQSARRRNKRNHSEFPASSLQDHLTVQPIRPAPLTPASGALARRQRPVVFIMHGFLQSSESYVSTERNLPFMLADHGFDVWLGNCRGNKYSCKHQRLDPESAEYWDFCLDHSAQIDIPAVLEYILQVTGAPSLSYIGFSQGTAMAFAAFSINPTLTKKVNLFVAMAPATNLKGFSNKIINALTRSSPHIVYLVLGRRRLLPSTVFWQQTLSVKALVKVIDFCVKFLFGWDMTNVHPKDKGQHYSHIYSYSSVKSVVQWFQFMGSGRFQMYDDHKWLQQNSKTYIQPRYPLDQIACPIALFYGGRDHLPDTARLIDSLPRDTFIYEEPSYEHLDFMYARSALKRIYPQIVNLCKAAVTTPHHQHTVPSATSPSPVPLTVSVTSAPLERELSSASTVVPSIAASPSPVALSVKTVGLDHESHLFSPLVSYSPTTGRRRLRWPDTFASSSYNVDSPRSPVAAPVFNEDAMHSDFTESDTELSHPSQSPPPASDVYSLGFTPPPRPSSALYKRNMDARALAASKLE